MASIGIFDLSVGRGHGLKRLLKNADTAMYHAKEQGRNNCQFYSSGLTPLRPNGWIWKTNPPSVEQEFVVFTRLEPNIHSCEILGAEALVRWKHPKRVWSRPECF
ncbi:MAG: diguanylate cyclase [Nitrospira sp.]|nr:diguanylate cyclase [Nitrospira sp.]